VGLRSAAGYFTVCLLVDTVLTAGNRTYNHVTFYKPGGMHAAHSSVMPKRHTSSFVCKTRSVEVRTRLLAVQSNAKSSADPMPCLWLKAYQLASTRHTCKWKARMYVLLPCCLVTAALLCEHCAAGAAAAAAASEAKAPAPVSRLGSVYEIPSIHLNEKPNITTNATGMSLLACSPAMRSCLDKEM